MARSLNSLAVSYRETAQLRRADKLFVRAMKIMEATKGSEHPYVARTLRNHSLVFRDQGKLDLAISTLEKSLAVAQRG